LLGLGGLNQARKLGWFDSRRNGAVRIMARLVRVRWKDGEGERGVVLVRRYLWT
jgi:hypothetical protein